MNLLIYEIEKHKEKIIKFSNSFENKAEIAYRLILCQINLLVHNVLSDKNFFKALEMCKQVDINDTIFVVFALQLDALLWSGDKKLSIGLEKLGFNKFFDFE